jgi:disulfide bond formation protein DsbB
MRLRLALGTLACALLLGYAYYLQYFQGSTPARCARCSAPSTT